MAFPWELNLDRPYRDEKWPFPEQRAWGESTDSAFRGSAENSMDFRQIVRIGRAASVLCLTSALLATGTRSMPMMAM